MNATAHLREAELRLQTIEMVALLGCVARLDAVTVVLVAEKAVQSAAPLGTNAGRAIAAAAKTCPGDAERFLETLAAIVDYVMRGDLVFSQVSADRLPASQAARG